MTGGTGALGLVFAEWMASLGARRATRGTSTYPVVMEREMERTWGTQSFPTHIPLMKNGEPVGATNRVSQPSTY